MTTYINKWRWRLFLQCQVILVFRVGFACLSGSNTSTCCINMFFSSHFIIGLKDPVSSAVIVIEAAIYSDHFFFCYFYFSFVL